VAVVGDWLDVRAQTESPIHQGSRRASACPSSAGSLRNHTGAASRRPSAPGTPRLTVDISQAGLHADQSDSSQPLQLRPLPVAPFSVQSATDYDFGAARRFSTASAGSLNSRASPTRPRQLGLQVPPSYLGTPAMGSPRSPRSILMSGTQRSRAASVSYSCNTSPRARKGSASGASASAAAAPAAEVVCLTGCH